MAVEDRDRLMTMAKVARMYYEDQIRQADIAKKLKLSKSMVSRLLQEARESGLVEVTIHYPWQNDSKLEQQLIEKFQLKDARVLDVESVGAEEVLRGVGVMGAELLETYLKDGMILALSRGSGVYSVIQRLTPQPYLNIRTVQLQGALGDRLGDGQDLSHVLSRLYSGEFYLLNAPLLLESREATETLMQQPVIAETLDLAKKADIALVGIGSTHPEANSLLRNSVIGQRELEGLIAQGIVGDIAGRHFDETGRCPDIEFNHRLVCIKLRNLITIPNIIGVATGIPKVAATRAALNARLVNMLATDSIAAQRLLTGD